jgi:hypothetical protein
MIQCRRSRSSAIARAVTICAIAAMPHVVLPARSAAQVVQADTAMERARHAFDFLVGQWQVAFVESDTTRRPSVGETYMFDRVLTPGTLGGRWHFNRGTPDKPDFVDALYYSAYDNASRAWSFYYISPQSGQAWPGREDQGRWNFVREFTISGVRTWQRQWWESVSADTIRRHIEASRDSGATWTPAVTITLRRQ